jgi:hypothetical protein
MWKDNSLHFKISPAHVEPVKAVLMALLASLQKYAIETLETQKSSELQRHQIPPTRMQALEEELSRLKEADRTIVVEGFEPGE